MKLSETLERVLRDSGTKWGGDFPEQREGRGKDSVFAVPPSWAIGPVDEIEGGFLLHPNATCSSLPVEFWNHELLEVDERDASSLAAFIGSWGIPYLPMRECVEFASDQEKQWIAETEKSRCSFRPIPKLGKMNGDGVYAESKASGTLLYVSRSEAESAVLWLKLAVLELVYGANGAPEHRIAEIVNRAAAPRRILRLERYSGAVLMDMKGSGLASCGLLTSAVCSQLVESFADNAEWRVCACDGCGRVFKRKRPEDERTQPHGDSKYCCTACKNRQAKRNQRAAAKNRIQH